MEIFFLLIGILVLYSLFSQGKIKSARSRCKSIEPVVKIGTAKFLEDLDNTARQMQAKANAELETKIWFLECQAGIDAALILAKSHKRACKASCSPNTPEQDAFIHFKNVIMPISRRPRALDNGWISLGPPPEPRISQNAEQYQTKLQVYKDSVRDFGKFIDCTTAELGNDFLLLAFFDLAIDELGLAEIRNRYFPETRATEKKMIIENPGFDNGKAGGVISSARPSTRSLFEGWPSERSSIGISNMLYTELQQGATDGRNSEYLNHELAETRRSESAAAEIRRFSESIGIPHLVHFTRCKNLVSIMRYGLRSVDDCEATGIEPSRNDNLRLDGRSNAISLSVTFPNYLMFYKYRQLNPSEDWAVLLLSPCILWEKNCSFFKHNAADARMSKLSRKSTGGLRELKELFGATEGPRDKWLRVYDPTDPQAEIMVYEKIEPTFIETVAFETASTCQKWGSTVNGLDRIVAGPQKGLFASRANVRLN